MGRSTDTRERLQLHALRLFDEHGFDGVTVEEIADAAGVSHMTFFRHFPTKESVILDDPYDPIIAQGVAHQPPRLPPLERTRLGLLEALTHVGEDDESVRRRLRLAAGHPRLRGRIWESNIKTERAIVEALVSSGSDPFDARIAAGAVMGALTASLLAWAEMDDAGSFRACILRALAQFDRREATA